MPLMHATTKSQLTVSGFNQVYMFKPWTTWPKMHSQLLGRTLHSVKQQITTRRSIFKTEWNKTVSYYNEHRKCDLIFEVLIYKHLTYTFTGSTSCHYILFKYRRKLYLGLRACLSLRLFQCFSKIECSTWGFYHWKECSMPKCQQRTWYMFRLMLHTGGGGGWGEIPWYDCKALTAYSAL